MGDFVSSRDNLTPEEAFLEKWGPLKAEPKVDVATSRVTSDRGTSPKQPAASQSDQHHDRVSSTRRDSKE